MNELWPWILLILLGVHHGINPGMGWLFAVTLGLQERSRAAVVRAFVPIALGHAASIAVVVALSPVLLRWAGAGVRIAYGLSKLIVPMSCPRWVGMRVGFKDLAAWSFIMASAHGAGLMLVPVLLELSGTMQEMEHRAHAAHEHWGHGVHLFLTDPAALADFAAVGLHTVAMFAVMAAVALVVYEKLGVMILKRTWFNLDLLWAGALVGAGVITLMV